jgi:hypothetical protein
MRTTIISTSKLKTNKIIGVVFFISLFLFLVGSSIMQVLHKQSIGAILIIVVWSVVIYKAIRVTLNLKSISYDDSSVYYEKDGYEVQVPFEEIRDIEIKTLTGIYVINLYRPAQDGDKIWFKTSMKYPFNFKKKDAEVNVLRDKIERYKRSLPEKNYHQLSSYNI